MALRDQAPTPQRLRRARSAGLSAFSPILTGAAVLASLLVYFMSAPGARWVDSILDLSRVAWQDAGRDTPHSPAFAQALDVLFHGSRDVLLITLLVALAVHLVQVGPRFSIYRHAAAKEFAGALPPRLGAWVVRVVVAVGATLGVVLMGLWLERDGIVDVMFRDRDWALEVTGRGVVSFCIVIVLALVVAGLLDLLAQRGALVSRLAMTREEVRAERYGDGGGSGGSGGGGGAYVLAARAREDAREVRVLGLELTAVQMRAHVVIVGGGVACALRYDTSVAPAPVVVANGDAEHGANIRSVASRVGVELFHDSALAKRLQGLVPGEMIHPETFAQVGTAFGSVKEVYQARGEVVPWEQTLPSVRADPTP